MRAGAVLFSEMTPAPEWEDDFNHWYDTHHIPIRMAAPGFLGAQRYRNVDGPAYLAVYDMQTPAALKTPDYQRIKQNPSEQTSWMLANVGDFTRYTGELISWQQRADVEDDRMLDSAYLYAVFFSVPAEREEAFNAWYVEDHVPLLLGCEHWLGCRRYRIVDGHPAAFTHMALHHLADLAALQSPAREAARATPWRAKLAAEPWFKGHYAVFSRHGAAFRATPAL